MSKLSKNCPNKVKNVEKPTKISKNIQKTTKYVKNR